MPRELSALIERLGLRITLAVPLFVLFVAMAVQGGVIAMPARGLALLAMAGAALWCIWIPRLPALSHLLLFAAAVLFAGLGFGLARHGLAELAPLVIGMPQLLLFGASLRHAAQGVGERA